jgi:hypothetical protein
VDYLSIELKIPSWCADGDDAHTGPILFVATTRWNLIHPTLVDWFGSNI